MTVQWFGKEWFGTPMAMDCPHIEVPVGDKCVHCEERFVLEDSGMKYASSKGPYAHRNCFLRQIIGSVAHVERRCSCFVANAGEGDPIGMTPRQAADAAVAAWQARDRQ
jgi:hypothetical protein